MSKAYQDNNQDYDIRDAFKTEKLLLLLSGFYPRRTHKYNWLFIISAILNLFVAYGQLFSMVVQMVIDRKNLEKLTETLLFFMTHFTFLCKLTNFCYYKKKLLELEDILTNPIYYGFSFDQLKKLTDKIAWCVLIAKIFRVLCVLVILFYALVPFIDEAEKKTLPLPGWLPYNATDYYYLKFIFQISSVIVSAYNNSTIDVLTWMLITVASAEFNILKDNLKNIDYKSTSAKNAEISFNNCVRHHAEIVKFAYKVESLFSKGIFLQFLASVVVICFTGFQMIVVPIPSVQFLFLISYFTCMMCQVAMYCWYGHDVMTTSNEIGKYFYMSNWYESDIRLRKNMFIFLESTKKPSKMTAGKFVTLSLTTLTAILRSSYSYFAVLQRLYYKEA